MDPRISHEIVGHCNVTLTHLFPTSQHFASAILEQTHSHLLLLSRRCSFCCCPGHPPPAKWSVPASCRPPRRSPKTAVRPGQRELCSTTTTTSTLTTLSLVKPMWKGVHYSRTEAQSFQLHGLEMVSLWIRMLVLPRGTIEDDVE
jgi:hypothetical protein